MRTIIAGSRDITDYSAVCDAVAQSGFTITTVISGMARGVDTLAVRYAEENGLPCEKYPADWERYGKSAGPRRNRQMAEVAEALILVWEGSSPGSRNMLATAREMGLKVHEYRVS